MQLGVKIKCDLTQWSLAGADNSLYNDQLLSGDGNENRKL